MAKDYTGHSRFFFTSYSDIQDAINREIVNINDVVICSDTQEQILITQDLKLKPIKSRVYRFTSVPSAEAFLNQATDSYQGQLVSILNVSTGTYQAYIVNKNNAGRFYVTSISIFNASDLDYNELGNKPIEFISGNIERPVVLSEQSDGLYKVEGAYKVSSGLETVFQSYNGDIVSVTRNNDGTTDIKIITSSSITDYLVDEQGTIQSKGIYTTKEWVESQGYVTEQFVDSKLEAMNIITREEALEYIQALIEENVASTVNQIFDDTFNERFDRRLHEKLQMEEQSNIQGLFS